MSEDHLTEGPSGSVKVEKPRKRVNADGTPV